MAINLTDAQRFAVEKKGNVLVAAAAGSGKTAVLVERVINILTSKENPVNADRLLIVTFTNAAAAEMRGRIEKRLDEECRNNPSDTSILMQKYRLNSAKICTIDSFCIDFVRENFEKLGISPDFAITDSSALASINERVLAEILLPFFEQKDPAFMSLLDIVGAEFDEQKLTDLILNIYEYSRQLPFPKEWFRALSKYYEDKNVWQNYALSKAKTTVKALINSLANAIDLVTVHPKTADKYLPFLTDTAEKLNDLEASLDDWDSFYKKLKATQIVNLPRTVGNGDIPEINAVKEIYSNINDKLSKNLGAIFYADSEFIGKQSDKLFYAVKLLSEILIEFDCRIFEALKQENTFTFHHTESMALQLLCEHNENGVEIRRDAEEFLSRFEEVCVDEYQDTNDLQNMLFYVLSNKDTRLFAVGDVKQSIYGFRGANPKNFLDKKNNRATVQEANEGEPVKIILGNNFRSHPKVCSFINYFFEMFMTDETGDIVYNNEEKLIASGEFPESQISKVGFDIITSKDSEEKAKVLEARRIAQIIKEIIAQGKTVRKDEKTLRKAEFSDFTILLRSMKNNASVYAEELRRQGIPVNYSKEGFCEFTEISTVLSLLKVIDNPNSDIELLTVMMSPIFGFTAEDMAKLRIENRDGNIYGAVIFSSKNGNKKTADLLTRLQSYRLYAVTNSLSRLIEILLDETDYLNIVSALPDGSRRRDNLRLLCEYAKSYDTASNANIGGFVNYILSQSNIKSASATGENSVKIMSIHASKGLQFPICIIAGTNSGFNNSEAREGSIFSADLGIGFKYFDEDDKTQYTTLGREVIIDSLKRQRLEEELRLFYVAMTRTQDILRFTGVVGDIEKKSKDTVSKLIASNCKISDDYWSKTKSYFDWLISAAILHKDGKELRGNGTTLICNETDSDIKVTITDGCSLSEICGSDAEEEREIDEDLVCQAKTCFGFEYPFEALAEIQSKVSVSALANKAESEKYSFTQKPCFMSKDGISATGRGTAMHKVMEFFDFSKWETPEAEIERLYEWQFLSENEAQSVNISALKKFFESDVFKRILSAETVKREMRFLTELPISRAYDSLSNEFSDENMIVQGAVDVCFVEDDGVVILDFKTDRTDNPQDLADAYSEQLNIYALACEKIFNKSVKEKIIYSFSLSQEIYL